MARTCGNFNMLIQIVLRATRVCIFSTSQSKSGPKLMCFDTFYFQMCFAPRACTFSTSQLPKVVRTRMFWHFLLQNMRRATTACTCSTSQLPKALRSWGVLTLFTSKCASRHNCVHLFNNISTSKSAPELRYFDAFYFKMCFAPQWCAIVHFLSVQMSPHLLL